MKELIKINNKWVSVDDWLKERTEYHEEMDSHDDAMALKAQGAIDICSQLMPKEKKVRKVRVEKQEVKGCKTYDEIVDVFEGDEQRPEVNKLSRKWQDRVTLSEDLGQLRALLGWPLYQEWLRETITG